MIIPSIDLMNGNAVQLVGGREKALDAGDPRPLAKRFRVSGDIAVIDLDAALGQGSNADSIEALLKIAPCRVGGGIRDVDSALRWLDAGAQRVILGTAAKPEIVKQLPRERVMAALDAVDGEVVVDGWRTKTGVSILERMQELREHVGSFLITFVEREGRLGGTAMGRVPDLIEAAGDARITFAGGVTTTEEISELHRLGADAQVGMALYTNQLDFGEAILAPLRAEGDLWPTVVTDELGQALGLAWSNRESVREAVRRQKGVYHSRRRGLWVKGESSGNSQELLKIDLDCDEDALRFTVRQGGAGFCHEETWTCWGEDSGLGRLVRRLQATAIDPPAGSFTAKLLADPALLEEKLIEEARELAEAEAPDHVAWEAADLFYFLAVALVRRGVPLDAVSRELERRALRVRRRS